MKHLLRIALLFLCACLLFISCEKPGDDKDPDPENKPIEVPAVITPPSGDPMGNSMVIYEANPRVFSTSRSLSAIASNLDRIQRLGVNVLWLMPIYPQGKKNAVGSPYCVRDYKGVNSDFGTVDDMKSLVSSAHSKGMKVILDWVGNHTSWDNAWITEHPEWYTQENGSIIPPKGTGWNDVADLNYNNSEMRSAMKEAMLYWVETIGVDGFRCDYTDGVPTDFWKDAINAIRAVKKDAIMLGESSDTKYYSSGFDMLYAWGYAGNLPRLYSANISLQDLMNTYNNEMGSTPSGKTRMRYIINHDTASSDGSPITLYKSEKGAMAAFVMSAFLQGVPMIYSSQEIAYPNKVNFFTNVIMDWKSKPEYQKEYESVMKAYTETAPWRGVAPDVKITGSVLSIRYKTSDGKGLLIYVNTKAGTQVVNPPKELQKSVAKDLITGDGQILESSLSIGANEYKILQIV